MVTFRVSLPNKRIKLTLVTNSKIMYDRTILIKTQGGTTLNKN